jgi:hypothetical protein
MKLGKHVLVPSLTYKLREPTYTKIKDSVDILIIISTERKVRNIIFDFVSNSVTIPIKVNIKNNYFRYL